jgi:hypothetical protein
VGRAVSYHHWQSIADDGRVQTFRCCRCMGKLETPRATPDDRRGTRLWMGRTLGRNEGPPPCAGRGTVVIRLVGRRYVKYRG